MEPSTRDLWLEDRRSLRDRHRDLVWWALLRLVITCGLLGVVIPYGWRGLAAATVPVVVVAGILLHLRARSGTPRLSQLADNAVLTGLGVGGSVGLLAATGLWGLFLLVALGATAPPVRRLVGDTRALLAEARKVAL